jgi:hypothetical protein
MTIQKKLLVGIVILTLHACKESSTEKKSANKQVNEKAQHIDTLTKPASIEYYRFKPDSLTGLDIKDFQIDHAYRLGNQKLITGYYQPVDGKIIPPDTEKDYGRRMLFLENNNDIVFKSKGTGDTYLYEPYFFKNKENGKTIVICQLAFEYFFGGEAFLIQDGGIKYMGNIDVEGDDPENKLVDIVRINETGNRIIITFNAKSLILQPGSKDIPVKNKNTRYEYDGTSFRFIR